MPAHRDGDCQSLRGAWVRSCVAAKADFAYRPSMTYADVEHFSETGSALFPCAVAGQLLEFERIFGTVPPQDAGTRIHGVRSLRPHLSACGSIGGIATLLLGSKARPVRAVFFNKCAENNWALAWHQDRTICVRERVDVEGFGPWTVKQGLVHVAPPVELLENMVTVRVHLDDVPSTNAPLLVSPGTHKLGRVPVGQVSEVVEQFGSAACLANAGDVWAYSTLILHASDAATKPANRRVLQVDFSVDELPGGLNWQGV